MAALVVLILITGCVSGYIMGLIVLDWGRQLLIWLCTLPMVSLTGLISELWWPMDWLHWKNVLDCAPLALVSVFVMFLAVYWHCWLAGRLSLPIVWISLLVGCNQIIICMLRSCCTKFKVLVFSVTISHKYWHKAPD